MVSKGSILHRLGAELKTARLNRQLSLADVSRLTSVPEEYLAAIEADNFTFMPAAYVLAHLRAYCREMNTGNEEIFEQCRAELQGDALTPPPGSPDADGAGRELTAFSAISRVLLVIFLFAGGGFGIWSLLDSQTSLFAGRSQRMQQVDTAAKVLEIRVVSYYSWVKVIADDGQKTYMGSKMVAGQAYRYYANNSFRVNIDRPECVEVYFNGQKLQRFTAREFLLQ